MFPIRLFEGALSCCAFVCLRVVHGGICLLPTAGGGIDDHRVTASHGPAVTSTDWIGKRYGVDRGCWLVARISAARRGGRHFHG
jgi:hypothetical protein